jgi:hypothetical protein
MSGNGNGNGNDPQILGTPLEQVVARLRAKESELEGDPLYAWKLVPVGAPITTEQLHTGLLSVSQIAEAAIDMGVHISSDLRLVVQTLPTLEQTVAQLRILNEQLLELNSLVTKTRREVQFLKDDTRDLAEKVRLVPAIKSMLADVLVRLPERA